MSNWTHVVGNLRLSRNVYSKNTDGEYVIKYPKEQGRIIKARKWCKEDPILVDMEIVSMPIVKRIVKPLIEKILPQGECGLTYYLNQRRGDYVTSRSYFKDDTEKEIFEWLCKKRFGDKYNDKDYKLGWIQQNDRFALTIDDDIRDCSGDDLYNAFMELLFAFDKEEITIDDGVMEWRDEWNSELVYRIHTIPNNCKVIFEERDRHKDTVERFDVLQYNFDTDKLVKENYDSFEELLEMEKGYV